jgi:hypothetical protein
LNRIRISLFRFQEENVQIMSGKIGRVIFALGVVAVMGIHHLASAEKWQAFKFKGDERYEYNITTEEGGEEKTIVYILDIKSLEGEKDMYEVSYITKGKLSKSDLGQQTAFGMWGDYGISLSVMVMNPMYAMLFQQVDIEVGKEKSLFGAAVMKVTGKEKVAGREGFVCKFLRTEGDKEILESEMVIDPDLALPLRSITYRDGKLHSQFELTKYTEY